LFLVIKVIALSNLTINDIILLNSVQILLTSAIYVWYIKSKTSI
jgi:hypothetical protein